MLKKFACFLIREKDAGIVYFVALVCVLVFVWVFLVTEAISIQQENAVSVIVSKDQ